MLLETGLSAADLERVASDLEQGTAAPRRAPLRRGARACSAPLRELARAGRAALGRPGAMRGEAWALIRLGAAREAAELLGEARAARRGPGAELAGSRPSSRTSPPSAATRSREISAAHAEFARALDLLDEADEPNDRLRLDIHQWRSRCYRRQRDWEAAREDIDRALELCEATRRRAPQRRGEPPGVARRRAPRALGARAALRRDVARSLRRGRRHASRRAACSTTSPASTTLLGNDDVAIAQLQEAFAIFVDAQPRGGGRLRAELARRDPPRARASSRRRSVAARTRARAPRGSDRPRPGDRDGAARPRARPPRAGRARRRPRTCSPPSTRATPPRESVSHQARSWMTRGELELLRENDAEAARLYREAATALQPPTVASPRPLVRLVSRD